MALMAMALACGHDAVGSEEPESQQNPKRILKAVASTFTVADKKVETRKNIGDNVDFMAESVAALASPASSYNMCVVTQATDEMSHYSSITRENHLAYATAQGNLYRAFHGRISGDLFHHPSHPNRVNREGLFWQDITAVEAMLDLTTASGDAPACRHVLWVDGDILFTDMKKSVEVRLGEFGVGDPNQGFISQDVVMMIEEWGDQSVQSIQAGVFLVKNSKEGRNFIRDIGRMFEAYKDEMLGDQIAMGDWVKCARRDPEITDEMCKIMSEKGTKMALLPQRAMDSFYGYGSSGDEEYNRLFMWEDGDFIAHFTGDKNSVTQANRIKEMRDLAARVSR